MIDELDEFLKKFLTKELSTLGYEPGKVDIVFDQPKREWSARISRPTLNLFLYDIRENQKLRQAQPAWETRPAEEGKVEQRRKPVRMDLHYLVTAWGTAPEDEHGLLSRTMMALLRYANLPDDEKALALPASLKASGKAIPLLIAQYEELPNPADVWNVLDNEMRPSIVFVLTVAVDPYAPVSVPMVRTRQLVVGESLEPSTSQLREEAGRGAYWTIGGHLVSSKAVDFEHVSLAVVEQGIRVPVQPDGRFVIGRLRAGKYSLEVTMDSGPPRRFTIEVPSADFELKI